MAEEPTEAHSGEKGFATTVIILAAAAAVVLAGGIYYFSHRRSVPPSVAVVPPSPMPAPASSTCGIDARAAQFVVPTIQEELARYPFLGLVPTDKSTGSFHPTSSQGFAYEGIKLTLPWPGSTTIQSRQGVGTQIRVSDGNFLMLVNPYPDQGIRQEFVNSLKTPSDRAKFDCLFGAHNLQSDTLFFNLVVDSGFHGGASSTPSDSLLAQSMLLPIKLTLFYDSSTQAIYRFSTPTYRVFEFTDWPVKHQAYVFLFDSQDRGSLITTSASPDEVGFIISSIQEL